MTSFRKAFFNFINTQRHTQHFTPEAKEKLYHEYRQSIGLFEYPVMNKETGKFENKKVDFGATAFEDLDKKKIKDFTGFKTTVVGKDSADKDITLEQALKGDDPDKKEVTKAINDVFKEQGFYTRAKEAYAEEIEQFKKKIAEIPEKYTVENLRGAMKASQEDAKRALEAQQKMELKKLKETFATPSPLMDKFQQAVGATDADQANTIKDQMIEELAQKHQEQLKEFDQSSSENLAILDKASAAEKEQLIFTAQLEKTAESLSDDKRFKMMAEIERVRKANRVKRGLPEDDGDDRTSLMANSDGTISAINPEDLDFIVSRTGKTIKRETKMIGGKEVSVWTAEMSHRILSPFYYASFAQNPKTEWLTMCQAVRASGFPVVVLTLDYNDPDTLKQRGREAYEAAIESGFSPENIVLWDKNGKELPITDFFTPGEKSLLESKSKTLRTKLDNIGSKLEKPVNQEEKTTQCRQEVFNGRNEERIRLSKAAITEDEVKADKKVIDEVISAPP